MNTQSEEMLSSAINKISDTLKQQKGAFFNNCNIHFDIFKHSINLVLLATSSGR